jgi:3-deoxy-manno-octulosonate cytidylyltransferase (CMP-KDO synthetase)
MKVFAFIPARYHSTRFPGKPLARICGKPMIQYVYERAVSCRELSEVYVATEDRRILRCVLEFGGKCILTDPNHLSGTDRICEAALSVGVGEGDVVVNVQGDQPLFHPSIIPQLFLPFEEDPSLLMTTLKRKIVDQAEVLNPNHVKVVTDRDGFALYFSRSPIPHFRDGDGKGTFYKHLGFYAFRMAFLSRFTRLPEGELESAEKLEQLRALEHGFRIKVLETDYGSMDVDIPSDIGKVEEALKSTAS